MVDEVLQGLYGFKGTGETFEEFKAAKEAEL